MWTWIRAWKSRLSDAFWVVPGAMILSGLLLAVALVEVDREGFTPEVLRSSRWLYNGAATGARTLLGAVAASAIGVAGTVFSITIAALSLAAGQMGPRLLRNFVRDRGNQVTLGALLATFVYALMVLRSVRAAEEGGFTPHLSLSVGLLLAFFCVVMIVYFVGHVASRINVDTVVALVADELQQSLRNARDGAEVEESDGLDLRWQDATGIRATRTGYLQELDARGLARWAGEHGLCIRLRVRAGHYVFPNSLIGEASPAGEQAAEACEAVDSAMVLGRLRTSSSDLEYAIRQLVEVAVRALSPGINDPFTAVGVIDRLGAALCELTDIRLPTGSFRYEGVPALQVPSVDYDALLDTMIHPLRQSAGASPLVLIRLMEVLAEVASIEDDPVRHQTLRRHASLILVDGQRFVSNPGDVADLRSRYELLISATARDSTGVSPASESALPRAK